jgi:hypothetical protein
MMVDIIYELFMVKTVINGIIKGRSPIKTDKITKWEFTGSVLQEL